MKILLVNPPGERRIPLLPLGLASIAAYLKSKNTDVSVIDAWAEGMGLETLENKVSQSKADIIGITMASPYYDKARVAIEICRQALPNSIIIAGGPHPSALPVETLQEITQLDICAIGEGELTMQELAEGKTLETINGIAYRDGKEIKLTPPRDFIKNLDDLPFPARELFPIEKYRFLPPAGREKPCFSMITSRGCPYHCAFCFKDVFKDIYRSRSPKNVVDEIEKLITEYGAKEIQFVDDDFSLNAQRAKGICEEILRRGLKFRWSCTSRVNLVNEELLRKMKEAGCWMVIYGIESGNQKILDSINKKFTVEQAISALEITRKVGLLTSCGFIIGLPGETKETIRETLDLAKKLKPDFFSCTVLLILPGSGLFKLIQGGKYQGKLKTMEKPAGTYVKKGNFTVIEENLTSEELEETVRKANREFYLRPQYIWQFLKGIRSFSDFKYYLAGGLGIIKSFIK
ncbi:MAG: radical SAM protein [bacterium]|nr:radical SAM protein [bacterium]